MTASKYLNSSALCFCCWFDLLCYWYMLLTTWLFLCFLMWLLINRRIFLVAGVHKCRIMSRNEYGLPTYLLRRQYVQSIFMMHLLCRLSIIMTSVKIWISVNKFMNEDYCPSHCSIHCLQATVLRRYETKFKQSEQSFVGLWDWSSNQPIVVVKKFYFTFWSHALYQ